MIWISQGFSTKFCKRLDQAKQFLKRKYYKKGEETTLYETRRPRPSGLQGHGALPEKIIAQKKERVKKSRKGDPVMRSGRVPKNTKDTPSKPAQEFPEKTEQSLQQKTQRR